jgi:hypothetical protein
MSRTSRDHRDKGSAAVAVWLQAGDEIPMRVIAPAARLLTVVVTVAAAFASSATLLRDDSFPPFAPGAANQALAEARGWSVATLLVALPLSLAAFARAGQGSLRARVIWSGTLAYFTYTYLELAVSPPFTWLYLVYVVAFASAASALVLAVAAIPPGKLFRDHAPRWAVAAFSLLAGTVLALTWLKTVIERIATRQFGWPVGVDAVGHVVRALDLGLQVPLAFAAGLLLLRRRPAGDLVAAIFLVNATCMAAALTGMVAWAEGIRAARPFVVLWVVAASLTLALRRARARPAPRHDVRASIALFLGLTLAGDEIALLLHGRANAAPVASGHPSTHGSRRGTQLAAAAFERANTCSTTGGALVNVPRSVFMGALLLGAGCAGDVQRARRR